MHIKFHRVSSLAVATSKEQKGLAESAATLSMAEVPDQHYEFATGRWFINVQWMSEVHTQYRVEKSDSKDVLVVPGPTAELDGAAPVK